MEMKISLIAFLPKELARAWLQHMRNFDAAHGESCFSVTVEAPTMTTGEVEGLLKIDPPFASVRVFGKKDLGR